MNKKTIRKGTYCLLIQLKRDQKITIGKKGEIKFNQGCYVYIGSAMNSLDGRLRRHLATEKKLHWHVDYLLQNPQSQITSVYLSDDGVKHECELADLISKQGDGVPGFGCSDCKCPSHLIYFVSNDEADSACRDAFQQLGLKIGEMII